MASIILSQPPSVRQFLQSTSPFLSSSRCPDLSITSLTRNTELSPSGAASPFDPELPLQKSRCGSKAKQTKHCTSYIYTVPFVRCGSHTAALFARKVRQGKGIRESKTLEAGVTKENR